MRRDDLDELVLLARDALEEPRRREMLRLPLAQRQRLVGDPLDDVLEEGVLAALRRARIGLDGEDLLAQQARQQRLQLRLGETRQHRQPLLRERLPEHGAVLDETALGRAEGIEPRSDERVQRLGHFELVDGADGPEHVPLAGECPAVEQHPHGLDRVQRHALGVLQDPCPEVLGQPGHETREQALHRLRRERLEVEGREAALAGAPARALLRELRPREREDEERVAPRPVEQVLEEVEQTGVSPLDVLEDQDGRRLLGEPLEEDPPGGEEVLLVAGRAVLEAEEVREARLDPGSLAGVQDVFGQREVELLPRSGRFLLLGDPAAHPHHLGQRPVGDAVPVRETAAAVPERLDRKAVDVLLELPGEP